MVGIRRGVYWGLGCHGCRCHFVVVGSKVFFSASKYQVQREMLLFVNPGVWDCLVQV